MSTTLIDLAKENMSTNKKDTKAAIIHARYGMLYGATGLGIPFTVLTEFGVLSSGLIKSVTSHKTFSSKLNKRKSKMGFKSYSESIVDDNHVTAEQLSKMSPFSQIYYVDPKNLADSEALSVWNASVSKVNVFLRSLGVSVSAIKGYPLPTCEAEPVIPDSMDSDESVLDLARTKITGELSEIEKTVVVRARERVIRYCLEKGLRTTDMVFRQILTRSQIDYVMYKKKTFNVSNTVRAISYVDSVANYLNSL